MASRPILVAAGAACAAAAETVAAAAVPRLAGGVEAAAVPAAVALALVAAALVVAAVPAPRVRLEPRHFIAASIGAAVIATRLALAPPPAIVAAPDGPVPEGTGAWEASVVSAGPTTKGMESLVLELRDPQLVCYARVAAYEPVPGGATVAWSGRIEAVPESDFGRWLTSRGIGATCEVTSLEVKARPNSLVARIEELRQASADGLDRVLPDEEAGLAAGILLGLRDRVDGEVASAFTTSGVSHIVAISGWNIAIVAGLVAAALRSLARRKRAIATIAVVAAYTVFVGASASVVRAALMSTAALTARELGGRARASVALAWAVVAILVLAPATISDPGFELSAAATAGLIAWGSAIDSYLQRRAAWIPTFVREGLGVSLAAQAATLPIVLVVFGRLAPVSPLVNLVAVPLVPPAMAAGAMALVAGWAAELGAPGSMMTVLALPAWLVLDVLIAIVRLGASLPGASLTLQPPWNYATAGLAAGAVFALVRRAVDSKRSAALETRAVRTSDRMRPRSEEPRLPHTRLALTAGIVVVLAGCVFARQPGSAVHVVALDVGQGDAILVEGNRGSRLLVDGGPDPGRLASVLDARLPPWSRRLDAIVLTHPHDDHVGGLGAIVRRYDVRAAFESGLAADTPAYRGWLDALHARSIVPGRLSAGQSLRLDDVRLDVLWPEPTDGPPRGPPGDGDRPNRQANDTSVVLLGTYGAEHFLLSGDAEDDVDPFLLARGLPRIDLLKVAHHGSGTATSQALVDAVRPAFGLVSVGAGNTYGHPSGATLARLGAAGAVVFRTDLSGTLEATLDGAKLSVRAERGATAYLPGGLLYDSGDDPQPRRERTPASIPRTAGVAPATLARRGRDRRVARSGREPRPSARRRGPRRRSGAPARHRQAGRGPPHRQRPATRRGIGELAVQAGLR